MRIKSALLLLLPLLIFSCSESQNTRSVSKVKKDSLNIISEPKTTIKVSKSTFKVPAKWHNEVFPNCIDTLFLDHNNYGYHYSCEQELKDSITYQIKQDELIIDIWDYVSNVDVSLGKEITGKYIFTIKNDTLIMKDIQRKYQNNFESVDKKFITQKYVR
jgi:hypothetical protein